MSRNQLDQSTSPYLLLHKDNPVHWYQWGPDALAEAERSGKPILLSIGFTACHWCHVMNRESFSDTETAALMNENFVNVKVDREERPDLDHLYQNAAGTMTARGGWPLTMFLTPKGVPFFCGTYIPKEPRAADQLGFKTVLNDAATLYRDKTEQIAASAARIDGQIQETWNRNMGGNFDGNMLDTVALRTAQRFDIFFGGLTGTQKFPSVPLVELLWRAYLRSGAQQFLQLMSVTLDHMLIAGLYDHVGGGFYRYCADERWTKPHFEKMANDNAQLIGLMTQIWQHNRNPICEIRIEETINWLTREMMVEDAFATSLDADSDGEEGTYYVWSESEIDAALMGTFVQKFKLAYSVTRDGNFNGKNILHRLASAAPYPQSDADEALLKRQRELLLAARAKRTAPIRDDKVLADTNGMIITALAEAGRAMNRAEWITAAIKAFDFTVKALGDGDRLSHSWRAGKRGHAGFADDYAHMARAALALWEVTGEERFLDRAKRWTHTLNEHFWDGVLGGYFTAADDDEALIVRTRPIYDQSQPPANSIMIGVLARLNMATADRAYAERNATLLRSLAGEGARVFPSMGSYFNNVEFAATNLEVVVVGPPSNVKTQELTAAVLGRSLPNRLLTVIAPDQGLPEGHVARGKGMENGLPTAYICQRGAVAAPITNPVTLSQVLQLPQARPAGTRPQ
jgi:uncharacterized protein YyaL (SSP411 family)